MYSQITKEVNKVDSNQSMISNSADFLEIHEISDIMSSDEKYQEFIKTCHKLLFETCQSPEVYELLKTMYKDVKDKGYFTDAQEEILYNIEFPHFDEQNEEKRESTEMAFIEESLEMNYWKVNYSCATKLSGFVYNN